MKKELSCITFENLGSHFVGNALFILRTSDSDVELDQYIAFTVRYLTGRTRYAVGSDAVCRNTVSQVTDPYIGLPSICCFVTAANVHNNRTYGTARHHVPFELSNCCPL